MKLTRRFFVFGTVAAVAAIKLPAVTQIETAIVPPARYPRWLTGVVIESFGAPAELRIGRDQGNTILQGSVAAGWVFRWASMMDPARSLIDVADHPLMVEVLGRGDEGNEWNVDMTFREADELSWLERYKFPTTRGSMERTRLTP